MTVRTVLTRGLACLPSARLKVGTSVSGEGSVFVSFDGCDHGGDAPGTKQINRSLVSRERVQADEPLPYGSWLKELAQHLNDDVECHELLMLIA